MDHEFRNTWGAYYDQSLEIAKAGTDQDKLLHIVDHYTERCNVRRNRRCHEMQKLVSKNKIILIAFVYVIIKSIDIIYEQASIDLPG
jgi:hypothetical protein